MISKYLFLIIIIPHVSLAADVSDAVNERIPVSRVELEAHWQVDCSAAWAGFERGVASPQPAGAGPCSFAPELRTQIELCSFIYQAPGSNIAKTCPDYRGALDLLDSPLNAGYCDEMVSFIESHRACPPD